MMCCTILEPISFIQTFNNPFGSLVNYSQKDWFLIGCCIKLATGPYTVREHNFQVSVKTEKLIISIILPEIFWQFSRAKETYSCPKNLHIISKIRYETVLRIMWNRWHVKLIKQNKDCCNWKLYSLTTSVDRFSNVVWYWRFGQFGSWSPNLAQHLLEQHQEGTQVFAKHREQVT